MTMGYTTERRNLSKIPTKLSMTVAKIANMPNRTNGEIIKEFYGYMRDRGS
jgi:hypothetical protein